MKLQTHSTVDVMERKLTSISSPSHPKYSRIIRTNSTAVSIVCSYILNAKNLNKRLGFGIEEVEREQSPHDTKRDLNFCCHERAF